jgi:flagellar hook-basal body complex protein FliE
MNLLSTSQAFGHQIALRTTDPRHIARGLKPKAAASAADRAAVDSEEGFGKLFFQALGQVNDLQVEAQDLSQALATDPDSVDIHDVTIALAEANLALSMTKAVIDRVIRAYQTIVNIR